jgi:AraC-like DNA-binding protein
MKDLRLGLAAEMMRNVDLSLKEIAAQLNFSSEALLCHQFKKRYGCRPSEHARRFLENTTTGAKSPDCNSQ